MLERGLFKALYGQLAARKALLFVSGPRQAGKTTFAKTLAPPAEQAYLNWDILDDKKTLLADPYFFEQLDRSPGVRPTVIFDEIHKRRNWKTYLKGVYDKHAAGFHFVASGSGRLELFRKGGDSLAGRFLMMHFFPLTLAELCGVRRPLSEFLGDPLWVDEERSPRQPLWEQLEATTGFPEPFLHGTAQAYRTWASSYESQIIREDLRELTALRELDSLEVLYALLPARLGSPLSINSLTGDVGASFDSVNRWLILFEQFLLLFRLSPWTSRVARSLKKERKHYFFNYAQVTEPGPRFENMVACELLRFTTGLTDSGAGAYTLHYVRNKERDEVDFLIAEGRKPLLLVEAKRSDETPSPALKRFQTALGVPAVQLVFKPGVCRRLSNGPREMAVISAARWLAHLP